MDSTDVGARITVDDAVTGLLAKHGGEIFHHGVKGQKWGVRNDKGHEGETAKTKKIGKLDAKFAKNSQSFQTTVALHNRAATLTNKNDVDRINNKPEYKNADFRRDSPLRQQYYKEHQNAFLDNLQKAADEMGTNASGTKKYGILEREDGSWDVTVDSVKHSDIEHADAAKAPDVVVHYDATGHITSLAVNTVAHGLATEDGVIFHHGVKGQKWGVRKDEVTSRGGATKGPTSVVISQKKPGTFAKAKGGKGHPIHEDALVALEARQRAKASTTDALSNAELKKVVERMNLEQQYSNLAFQSDRRSKGMRFVAGLLGHKRYTGEKRKFSDPLENQGEHTRKAAEAVRTVLKEKSTPAA